MLDRIPVAQSRFNYTQGLNSISSFVLQRRFGIVLSTKIDVPLNKETKRSSST